MHMLQSVLYTDAKNTLTLLAVTMNQLHCSMATVRLQLHYA